jgi:hypothetical protein
MTATIMATGGDDDDDRRRRRWRRRDGQLRDRIQRRR